MYKRQDDEDDEEGRGEAEDDDDEELDGGGGRGSSSKSSDRTCPHCNKAFSRSTHMRRHAHKCTDPTFVHRRNIGEPCTPLVPGWTCIVPEIKFPDGTNFQFPDGTKAMSAEVKFMTLSNVSACDKRMPRKYYWGGSPTWTIKEMEAINAQRADGDNINTIVVCCMDPLTGDIHVFVHYVDVLTRGKYSMDHNTFRASDYADGVVPPRHRSEAQLQKWLDLVEAWFESPPAVIIHLHPKGSQNKHYDKMRPKVATETKHLYGLGCPETSEKSLFHSRQFLSTRASLFDKPSIGDNFIETLVGKDAVARVKAFNALFAGADNRAIGNMGESIAKDVLLLLGASEAVNHPTGNHHYDLLYFTAT